MKSLRSFLPQVLLTTLCLFALAASSLAAPAAQALLNMRNPEVAAVAAVQDRHTPALLNLPGVVGTATGLSTNGQVVVKIFTEVPGLVSMPASLDGVPVEIEVTGPFYARIDTTSWQRPASIGISVGHPDITAGTIGARVTDDKGIAYILSNNHVLADVNQAAVGDAIYQPGPYDGGTAEDTIATLTDFVPIDFKNANIMDAAIAEIILPSTVTASTPGIVSVESYGTPSTEPVDPILGMPVQKVGRTTGWTHGEIYDINVTVNVCYASRGPRCTQLARFTDQVLVTPGTFSDGGDSGSLIVSDDESRRPVALLFAGSATHTIATPVKTVLNHFDVIIDDGTTSHGTLTVTATDAGTGTTIHGLTVSLANGRYINEIGTSSVTAPAATYPVVVTAEGYAPATEIVTIPSGNTATLDVVLLDDKPITISGIVSDDETGANISNGTVSTETGVSTETTDSGYYSLALSKGTHTLTALAPDHLPTTLTDTFATDSFIDFQLAPGTILPEEDTFTEADSYSTTLNNAIRLQEVYSSSYFAGNSVTISALAFRSDSTTPLGTTPIPDLRIQLSTTDREPDDLSPTFAENVGSGLTTVFSGPASITTTVPGAFEITFPFATLFPYNPAQGNLLVDITSSSANAAPNVEASSSTTDAASRVFSLNPSSSSGSTDSGADVIQLHFTTSTQPPEPPSVEPVAYVSLSSVKVGRNLQYTAVVTVNDLDTGAILPAITVTGDWQTSSTTLATSTGVTDTSGTVTFTYTTKVTGVTFTVTQLTP